MVTSDEQTPSDGKGDAGHGRGVRAVAPSGAVAAETTRGPRLRIALFAGLGGTAVLGALASLLVPDTEFGARMALSCLSLLMHLGISIAFSTRRALGFGTPFRRIAESWCVVSAGLMLIAPWGNHWRSADDLFVSCILTWGCLTACAPAARLLFLRSFERSAWLHICSALVALAFTLVNIWLPYSLRLDPRYIFSSFVWAAATLVHVGVLMMAGSPRDRNILLLVPAIMTLVSGLGGAALVWVWDELGDEVALRLVVALLVAVIGSVIPAAAMRAMRGRAAPASSKRPTVDMACPRCRSAMQAPTGVSACQSCGTKVRLSLESDVCLSCGYSLVGVGQVCPECGSNHGA
jgi:hypothetical protein